MEIDKSNVLLVYVQAGLDEYQRQALIMLSQQRPDRFRQEPPLPYTRQDSRRSLCKL